MVDHDHHYIPVPTGKKIKYVDRLDGKFVTSYESEMELRCVCGEPYFGHKRLTPPRGTIV